MKFLLPLSFLFTFLLGACADKIRTPDHSTDLKCAHSFIRCLYDGKFDAAEKIILADEAGINCLKEKRFKYHQGISSEDKKKYKKASVLLDKEVVNDSVVVYKYTDPVKNRAMPPIRVIKHEGNWLVDYAYSCSGNL
jgi:hypothetical protein